MFLSASCLTTFSLSPNDAVSIGSMHFKEKENACQWWWSGASRTVDPIMVTPLLRWAPTEKVYLKPQRWLADSRANYWVATGFHELVLSGNLFCFCFKRCSFKPSLPLLIGRAPQLVKKDLSSLLSHSSWETVLGQRTLPKPFPTASYILRRASGTKSSLGTLSSKGNARVRFSVEGQSRKGRIKEAGTFVLLAGHLTD